MYNLRTNKNSFQGRNGMRTEKRHSYDRVHQLICAFPPFFHSTYSGDSCWYLCYRWRCRPHRGCLLLFFYVGLSLEHFSQNCWRLHQKRICFCFVIVIHFFFFWKKFSIFLSRSLCAPCVCVGCPIWVAFVHRFNFNASNFVLCTYRWSRKSVQTPYNCIKQQKFTQQIRREGKKMSQLCVGARTTHECIKHNLLTMSKFEQKKKASNRTAANETKCIFVSTFLHLDGN